MKEQIGKILDRYECEESYNVEQAIEDIVVLLNSSEEQKEKDKLRTLIKFFNQYSN